MYTVLVTEAMSDAGMDWLRKQGVKVKYGRGIDTATLIEDIQGCQAVITRLAILNREVLSSTHDLKVIARHGAGVDSVDVEYCKANGITVLRNVGTNSTAVAEHAVALITALAKKLKIREEMYKNNEFVRARKEAKAIELKDKILGLVGFGHIGGIVANICKNGFGMKVIAYDPYISNTHIMEGVTLVSDKAHLFSEADFISVHMPATSETKNSIGKDEFALMKKTAYFINTARGTIVDEEALIEVLRNKRIAGAGLDVTLDEPALMDNPLFSFENVIMTPHCAGSSEEALIKASMACAKGCFAVLNNMPVEEPAVIV